MLALEDDVLSDRLTAEPGGLGNVGGWAATFDGTGDFVDLAEDGVEKSRLSWADSAYDANEAAFFDFEVVDFEGDGLLFFEGLFEVLLAF